MFPLRPKVYSYLQYFFILCCKVPSTLPSFELLPSKPFVVLLSELFLLRVLIPFIVSLSGWKSPLKLAHWVLHLSQPTPFPFSSVFLRKEDTDHHTYFGKFYQAQHFCLRYCSWDFWFPSWFLPFLLTALRSSIFHVFLFHWVIDSISQSVKVYCWAFRSCFSSIQYQN